MSIECFAALAAGQALEPFRYDPLELGAEDVEIAISHCGICHSDIHMIDNDWDISRYPLVPGHEIIGHVSAAGSNVKAVSVGDRVGVGWQCGSCVECEWCRRGEEPCCAQTVETCVGRHAQGKGVMPPRRSCWRFAFFLGEPPDERLGGRYQDDQTGDEFGNRIEVQELWQRCLSRR